MDRLERIEVKLDAIGDMVCCTVPVHALDAQDAAEAVEMVGRATAETLPAAGEVAP
jgi:hypothetical protein